MKKGIIALLLMVSSARLFCADPQKTLGNSESDMTVTHFYHELVPELSLFDITYKQLNDPDHLSNELYAGIPKLLTTIPSDEQKQQSLFYSFLNKKVANQLLLKQSIHKASTSITQQCILDQMKNDPDMITQELKTMGSASINNIKHWLATFKFFQKENYIVVNDEMKVTLEAYHKINFKKDEIGEHVAKMQEHITTLLEQQEISDDLPEEKPPFEQPTLLSFVTSCIKSIFDNLDDL